MTTIIFGNGGLGRAVDAALRDRSTRTGHADQVRLLGRPPLGRHHPDDLAGIGLAIEASRADAVVSNLEAALAAGARRVVVATTGWEADREAVEALLLRHRVPGVAAPNFSLGVALFARLVDAAVELFGSAEAFDPYLVEWHRRGKRDRPSGTAIELRRRIAARHPRLRTPDDLEVASIRAGASPGMHLVGFDSPGETVELRLTARDRGAYAAGILAAADWLAGAAREPGLHPFEPIVDELLVRPIAAA